MVDGANCTGLNATMIDWLIRTILIAGLNRSGKGGKHNFGGSCLLMRICLLLDGFGWALFAFCPVCFALSCFYCMPSLFLSFVPFISKMKFQWNGGIHNTPPHPSIHNPYQTSVRLVSKHFPLGRKTYDLALIFWNKTSVCLIKEPATDHTPYQTRPWQHASLTMDWYWPA